MKILRVFAKSLGTTILLFSGVLLAVFHPLFSIPVTTSPWYTRIVFQYTYNFAFQRKLWYTLRREHYEL